MSRSTPTQLRNSYTKPELSPASSQSAAAAEADTIRRLRREVLGLTLAVDSMKKNSKEWEFLNSKLEVAREELDAVLQDEQLFRSISPAGSGKKGKKTLTTRSISEENCNELLQMIPTPPLTPSPVAPKRVEELEEKLGEQVKYSLEWFETKKKIDAERKKSKHDTVPCAEVNVNLDKKFFRSSTTGSIVAPTRREGPKKLPSTGTSKSERPRSTAIASIKDQNIKCLKGLLDDVPKYSLEWFEIKRIIHRRSNKDPKLKTVQREKSHDAKQIKENSAKDVVAQSQQKQHDAPSNDNRSHCKDAKECTDLISMTEHTLSTTDNFDADLVVPNSKAIQDKQRLQDFLERVPKFSRLVTVHHYSIMFCLLSISATYIFTPQFSLIAPVQR